jgi:hypothetical protein
MILEVKGGDTKGLSLSFWQNYIDCFIGKNSAHFSVNLTYNIALFPITLCIKGQQKKVLI